MKIVNMEVVENLIKEHNKWKKFWEYEHVALEEATEPLQTNPRIRIAIQYEAPRTMSSRLTIPYGTELYWAIMECIENEMKRLEKGLEEL